MQPAHLFIGIFSNLFTLALLGADAYLLRQWYRLKDSPYAYLRDEAHRELNWAIGIGAFLLLWGLCH